MVGSNAHQPIGFLLFVFFLSGCPQYERKRSAGISIKSRQGREKGELWLVCLLKAGSAKWAIEHECCVRGASDWQLNLTHVVFKCGSPFA